MEIIGLIAIACGGMMLAAVVALIFNKYLPD